MAETRARKQKSVISHAESIIPKASDLIMRISNSLVDPTISAQTLESFASESRILFNGVSEALSELKEFCEEEDINRFQTQLLQVQATLASVSTQVMSKIMSRSQSSQSDSLNSQIVETLKNLVQTSRMPLSEPSIFKGDPLECAVWKSELASFIDREPAEKIHCLKKYTSGAARECIEGFLTVFSNDSYRAARKMLDTRFGDKFVVTFAFREKLEKWPKIANNDCKGLQKFSDFLKQIQSNLTALNTQDVLNDAKENYKMLKVLPQWIVNKWADKIAEHQERNNDRFPPFESFVTFVGAQSKRVNNPIIAQLSSSSRSVSSTQGNKPSSSGVSRTVSHSTSTVSRSSCLCCGGSHSLQKCDKFTGLSYDDKVAFVRENRLCFGCFYSGHRSRDCRRRMKCDVCERSHPTLLHNPANTQASEETPSEQVVSNAFSLNKSDSGKSSMVVPVWLTHSKCPNRPRLVYALLDSQSDSSFILDHTLDSFNVDSKSVNLNVSTMTGSNQSVSSRKVSGFTIRGHNLSEVVTLPSLYSRPEIPHNRSHIPSKDFCSKYSHLKRIADSLSSFENIEVGLLIGFDCSRASRPLEVILGKDPLLPYALRTPLGWTVVGSSGSSNTSVISHRIVCSEKTLIEPIHSVKEVSPRNVLDLLEKDFKDVDEVAGLSQEDKRFNEKTSAYRQVEDGRYEVPMPFKESLPELECNIELAEKRLEYLRRKMDQDAAYKEEYTKFMAHVVDLEFCEPVPEDKIDSRPAWYIPHHGIYHRVKKKLRVVYDCSAKYRGVSLNDCLITGPDLITGLVGILLRFRKEPVAFMCDVTKMFPQFLVPESQRDYLRFLWWKDGKTTTPPQHMRMTRHVFGAVSSMGCANIGMRAIAKDYEDKYGKDCSDVIRSSFYVDDCLHSVATPSDAVDLITRLCSMLKEGQVELAKFVSSSPEVLNKLDKSLVSEKVLKIDLESKVEERALGVVWDLQNDVFTFSVSSKLDAQLSRRKVLSIIASVFDPLGLVSPFVLQGKRILQDMCLLGLSWDEKLPADLQIRFEKWLSFVPRLQHLQIARCLKPVGFDIKNCELHHFCDASSTGYGVCSYIRLLDSSGTPSVNLVFAKSRVSPVKPVTIPRLELSSAVLAVKVAIMLDRELQYSSIDHFFYTDSKVVLGYICNSTKRFHVFVANRVGFIQSHTTANQWSHIDGKKNPADIASRGANPSQMKESNWLQGPTFLQDKGKTNVARGIYEVNDEDKEVKKIVSLSTVSTSSFYVDHLSRFSSFNHLIRCIALIFLWLRMFKTKQRSQLSADDLYRAKISIIRLVQREHFSALFRSIDSLPKGHPLTKLNVFVDSQGILRVGGRLVRSHESFDLKFPILIPAKSQLARLIICHCHSLVFHQGRGLTLNSVRQCGFYIFGSSSIVSRIIYNCVTCKKLRGRTAVQLMSDLPSDRLTKSCPFEYCGIDFFGPFFVKSRRSTVKMYGCLFTCLYSRAVHVETCSNLSTDSFLLALRRFVALRGPVVHIRCDRGTNLVGASNELKLEIEKMNYDQISRFVQDNHSVIEFKFNPPSASNFGGVFERQIGSVRRVFEGILSEFGHSLNPESLSTFLHEAAAVVNSRPLSCVNITDETLEPLTPNHLLTGKSRIVVSPPGKFVQQDMYLLKHWRRIQYLANLFWTRWRHEYLSSFHRRSKWTQPTKNFAVGDVVLLSDDNAPRNEWKMARIIEVYPSSDGLVRSVKLKVASKDSKPAVLDRPINKLIPLVSV